MVLRAALVILWVAGVFLGSAAEGEDTPRVEWIRFHGNTHLGAGSLRAVMRLKQPRWWIPFGRPRFLGSDFLLADLNLVTRRYQEAGFPLAHIREARVEYLPSGDRVRLDITVDEGPKMRYRSFTFRGVQDRWLEKVSGLTKQKRGDLWKASALETARLRIAEFYGNQGQLLSQMGREIRYGASDSVDVVFRVVPGPYVGVDSIQVSGANHTRRETVLREIPIRKNDLLTTRRLSDSRQRLLGTGIFTRVTVTPEFPDSTRLSRARVRIDVTERKRNSIGAGAGFSSEDQVRISFDYGRLNLGGLGRSVSLNARLFESIQSDFRGGGLQFKAATLGAGYRVPHPLATRNLLLVNPEFGWERTELYEKRSLTTDFTLRREINRTTRVDVTLRNKAVWSTDPLDPNVYTTRGVAVNWNDDTRDNPFDAREGYYAQFVSEYAGFGGASEFTRFSPVWQAYHPLAQGWTVAGRVRLGAITPISSYRNAGSTEGRVGRVPLEERWQLGGSTTVRGYEEGGLGQSEASGQIGGLALFLASVELRFPIWRILSGGFFVDAGNVWSDPAEIKLRRFVDPIRRDVYSPLDVAYAAGAGLRFTTPVGPLRLDYGVKMGPVERSASLGKVHVSLGQAF